MTVAYWENILPFIITGRIFRQNTRVLWTVQLPVEDPRVPIYRDSGMFKNRKQIFSVVMLLAFFPADISFPKPEGFGTSLKDNLAKKDPGPWRVGSHMMGETIPKETNFLSLDPVKKDEWGVPHLRFSVDYDENDDKMIKDFFGTIDRNVYKSRVYEY